MRFLLRYGEIGIKSRRVRARFEHRLVENIKSMLLREGIEGLVSKEGDRIFLVCDDARADACGRVLGHTFGLVSFSGVGSVASSDVEDIATHVCTVASRWGKGSFAVRCRRVGTHGYTSMTAAARVGERVLDANPSLKVDLTNPDHEVFVEIRHRSSYIYTDITEGPGGMPVGSAGRVAAVVNDREGALAVWLMMKRGCQPLLMGDREVVEQCLLPWLPNLKFYDGLPIERLISYAERILISKEMKVGKMAKPEAHTIFYPMVGLLETDIERLVSTMMR